MHSLHNRHIEFSNQLPKISFFRQINEPRTKVKFSGFAYGLAGEAMETDCEFKTGIPANSAETLSTVKIHVDWFFDGKKIYSSHGSSESLQSEGLEIHHSQ